MNTIESVCNAALDQIGYKRHISSIWEGSVASRIALDLWGQTRDETLSATQPAWARKDATLVVKRQAPADFYQSTSWTSAYPPFPYYFSYVQPSDCLVPLQIKSRAFDATPPWRPRYIPFREAVDTLDGSNVILTNQADAILTYTSQVLSTVVWHDEFTALMIRSLAQKFALLVPQAAPQREPQNANPS